MAGGFQLHERSSPNGEPPGAAWRGGLVARIVGGSLLLGVTLALVFVAQLVTIDSRSSQVRAAAHASDLLTTSFETQKLVVDAETGTRGYLLTRNRSFLQPYEAALDALPEQLGDLTAGAGVTGIQRQRADAITAAVNSYLRNWAAPAVARGATHGETAELATGRRLIDAIRAQFDTFDAAQRGIADAEAAHADYLGRLALVISGAGVAGALLLMTLYAFYTHAMIAPVREVARAARRVARGELGVRVAEGGRVEVGELITAFNRMATALERGREALETQNDELEAQGAELQALLDSLDAEKARTERSHEFAQALAGHTDLRRVGATLLQYVCEDAGADVGVLYAAGGAVSTHTRIAARGVALDSVAATVNPGEGPAGRALAERRPVAAAPGDAGLPIALLGGARPARHELSVPLLLGEEEAGVITIARAEDRAFDNDEVAAVERLAGQAAVAVTRAQMQHQTERSLRTVQSVVDATPSPIALVAPEGNVVFENPPMAKLREQFADEPSARSAFVTDRGDPSRRLRDELVLDGGSRVLSRYVAPLTGERNATIGRIVVLRDVSAEREAERLKDEFFALVSHELRTPLTSIIGYLELTLEDDADGAAPLDPQRRHFLEVVNRNAQRLLRLVGDLLFAAQVEAGTMSLDRGRLDLGRLAREAVEAATPRAANAGVELTLDGDCDVWLPNADRDRIGQVLDNLIVNAIKFTPAGGTVTVGCTMNDERAELSVADTGVGIPAAEQTRLFERFFRARQATEQSVPGVGLGLTIVRAIVSGHGGEITVESAPGEGTTFRVSLPLRRAGDDVSGSARPARAGAAPEG